jgi:NADH-quinone oxidoreductase subunit I
MAEPPPRSRGVIALREENCTVCMICVRECPDWCITIDGHAEHVPPEEGSAPNRRPRSTTVLDRFAIDFSLCMYCGICIETCPFDALFWAPDYAYDASGLRDLTAEKGRLVDWLDDVRAPEPLDAGAEIAPEPARRRGRA